MILVVGRIKVLSVPARWEVCLSAHLGARLLQNLNTILTRIKADVRNSTIFKLVVVVGTKKSYVSELFLNDIW